MRGAPNERGNMKAIEIDMTHDGAIYAREPGLYTRLLDVDVEYCHSWSSEPLRKAVG